MAVRTFTTLADPWWKRQPHESLTAYTRFCRYRDQPADDPDYTRTEGRSLMRIADGFRISDRTIEELARKHRWDDRADAYDAHRRETESARHARAIEAAAEQLASAELAAAADLTSYLRASVRNMIGQAAYLEPNEIPVVADAISKLHTAAATAHDAQGGAE
jgi:hypothetical protein